MSTAASDLREDPGMKRTVIAIVFRTVAPRASRVLVTSFPHELTGNAPFPIDRRAAFG